jgi:protease-4
LVNVTDFRVRNYPDYKLGLEDKLSTFPFIKTKEKVLIEEIGEDNYRTYQKLKQISRLKGIQARIPFIINIK